MLRICAAAAIGAATLLVPHTAGSTPTVAYLRAGDVYVDDGGGTVHRLTTDGRNSRPRWSPDGRRIAYLHAGALWVMDAHGTGKRQVAASAGGGASWSPDGRRLAFVAGCDGMPEVFTVDRPRPQGSRYRCCPALPARPVRPRRTRRGRTSPSGCTTTTRSPGPPTAG